MQDELFRGYIETRGKQAIEKFKNREDFKTYEQVRSLDEFAGILGRETILIDVDDYEQSEILFNIVVKKKLGCRVYKTTRGKHFLFRNSGVDACKTGARLACGLTADIKVGVKNAYSILKFAGTEREILYDVDDYEEVPKWLTPVKSNVDFLNMGEGDGRNQAFFNYILTLQSAGFTTGEVRECIEIINRYVVDDPLDEKELEVILRDEAFEKPNFFSGKTFLFDKFARYLVAQHHIIRINGQLHFYKDGIYEEATHALENLMIDYIPNLNRQKRKEVFDYIDVLVRENTAPSSADYIAFRNGVYNISTEDFMQFSPNIIITNKINFDYNPNAYSEVVDKTLNKLACNDKSVRALLEEAVGYCMYRRNELRKAFMLTGERHNGKSTYIDMVATLLGQNNISALDLKELGERFKTAELFGKLANLGDDIGDEFVANTSVLKKLISGDRLNVERKGKDPFDFSCYSKFIFSANAIPRMGRGRDSAAIIDRLIIVPFNAKFSPNDPDFDPYIKYKLRTNEAMEYLIQIALDGLYEVLHNNKFTTNEAIQKELEEYEETNNPTLQFFKELDENGETVLNETTKDVYLRYTEFCITNGLQPISKIEFSKHVKKRYDCTIEPRKINGKSVRIIVKQ